jgi:hypothetical protein
MLTFRPVSEGGRTAGIPEFMADIFEGRLDPTNFNSSPIMEKTLVNNSDERLHSVLATLEGCRVELIDSTYRDTAQLLSVAILELRMKLNRIADVELKALCEALMPDDGAPRARPQEPNSPYGRRRPLLKLVK